MRSKQNEDLKATLTKAVSFTAQTARGSKSIGTKLGTFKRKVPIIELQNFTR